MFARSWLRFNLLMSRLRLPKTQRLYIAKLKQAAKAGYLMACQMVENELAVNDKLSPTQIVGLEEALKILRRPERV